MAEKPLQKSRANQGVSDELLATFTAAKGFLIATWIGAILMLISFTQLYVYGLRPGANVGASEIVGLALFILGTAIYWRSRAVYLRLDFPWRRGVEIGATLVAATAAVFWLLFIVATVLVWRGVDVF